MKIIAKINFIFNGIKYLAGEQIKVTDIQQVYRLNELGYIEPLKYEELVLLERQLNGEKLLNNEVRKSDDNGY